MVSLVAKKHKQKPLTRIMIIILLQRRRRRMNEEARQTNTIIYLFYLLQSSFVLFPYREAIVGLYVHVVPLMSHLFTS